MSNFEMRDGILVIEGELTVEHAVAFRDALLAAFEGQDGLTVELGKVTVIDLACLQLLCSALKSTGSLKRNITLNGSPEALREAVKYFGSCQGADCVHRDNRCFIMLGG